MDQAQARPRHTSNPSANPIPDHRRRPGWHHACDLGVRGRGQGAGGSTARRQMLLLPTMHLKHALQTIWGPDRAAGVC